MNVLGISAFVHDAAACLIRDGELVANVEEERLNRIKHTNQFPKKAIEYVLAEGNISLSDVDVISFNWDPFQSLVTEIAKFFLITPPVYALANVLLKKPKHLKSVLSSLRIRAHVHRALGEKFKGEVVWVPHHLSHAASSYFFSKSNKADVLVADAHGERKSLTLYKANDYHIKRVWDAPITKSLGVLYTLFTHFLGFKNFEEGKFMALASFGKKNSVDACRNLIKIQTDGQYKFDLRNFAWQRFVRRAFGNPRKPSEEFTQYHYDIAASIQERIKDAILNILRDASQKSGNENVCLAGGLFLNCDINKAILDSGIYQDVFIPPFSSDTGGAVGSAVYASFGNGNEKFKRKNRTFYPYTGPQYNDDEVVTALQDAGLKYDKPANVEKIVANELIKNKVIGYFQGRMEAGPRALGNRSILANPCYSKIKDILNKKVKKREPFRPFAPITTEEGATKYFNIESPIPDPFRYMLMTTTVKDQHQEYLPGITHVDGTARVQVIKREWTPKLHKILKEFEVLTKYPVLINTSFNKQEPIVCDPKSAINCFLNTNIDVLVLNDYIVYKNARNNHYAPQIM